VYKSGDKRFTDFESMLAEIARADVAFVGEQHDDPATHRMERAVLEGLARRRMNVIVAMEMFERDTQPALDDYLAGRTSEEDFLKISRPWPNYATDYRGLIEFSRAHMWKVVASNAPRRIASQVSKQGLDAARSAPEADRKLVAADFSCPIDDYYKRFVEAMNSGHPMAHQKASADNDKQSNEKQADKKQEEENRALMERFYQAQCAKDETMAESIANAFKTASPATPASGQQLAPQGSPLVVHFNGAFHSDYRLGTAARVVRRMPKSNVKVISIVPVDDLDTVNVEEYRKRGDYILFTLKPFMPKHASAK
jgi:uncharacterized iron-regulated protein